MSKSKQLVDPFPQIPAQANRKNILKYLTYLDGQVKKYGMFPTGREMQADFGYKSSHTAFSKFWMLAKHGLIATRGKRIHRGYYITKEGRRYINFYKDYFDE